MSPAATPTEPEKTLMQKIIPQQTNPLGKFIRTGEGWLVFAFNLALLIIPIVSSSLSQGPPSNGRRFSTESPSSRAAA